MIVDIFDSSCHDNPVFSSQLSFEVGFSNVASEQSVGHALPGCATVSPAHAQSDLIINEALFVFDTWRFFWEIMKKSRVWNDFLKNMCSKDTKVRFIR